ncbi:hypothetical protein HGI47_18315 [Novosphingobium sp. ERN07]|uniref:winged helix-turn-helix domain-containing protein n=1 Tax=Novosphingobium sp. ERN07 TaxID=2726187 RepID=UPI0014567CFB|nr:winged helix-turn-helix domain-containing protein [Novosphingobium sp. ERN07]NLR72833.1 hypothetical protein [Novosphingobium sp. ERN07]
MDSYLEIARAVLKSSRQPMSARQILRTAHQLQLVPRDLFGRTQHKTMQARLASDILRHRSRSDFYRTGPGRFFLRMFQNDRNIPDRHRREYIAPLRAAQLGRFDAVAFPRTELAELGFKLSGPFLVTELLPLSWSLMRLFSLRKSRSHVPFRFLLVLFADGQIFLQHRKPTSDGDISHHSAIGIEGVVRRDDQSLFSPGDLGLADAAARTLFEHFELPHHVRASVRDERRWSKPLAVIDRAHDVLETDILTYIGFQCAGISEITDAVEAWTACEWISFPAKFNDLSRFDKSSARVLSDAELQAALCS